MEDFSLVSIWNMVQPYVWLLGAIATGIIAGSLIHLILWLPLRKFASNTETDLDDILNKKWRRPTRYVLITLTLYLALPLLVNRVSEQIIASSSDIVKAALTASIIYALVKLVYVIEEAVLERYHIEVKDNLHARQMHTRVKILRRISITLIILIGLGLFLLSFEQFREIGTGLLASAGIAGIVLGLAAQKTLSNLIAGIQIAITQPIRLDDVVIVENEWGRIEEITLTFVVVRIWDLRRLVLPISYFLEKPFQNWTRVSADIMGTVSLFVDYTVPVEKVREELTRLVKLSDKWDGKVNSLQVTNTTDRTVELRALVSAADASLAWDLRCELREGLLKFLKENFPSALPRARVELDPPPLNQ